MKKLVLVLAAAATLAGMAASAEARWFPSHGHLVCVKWSHFPHWHPHCVQWRWIHWH